VRRVTFEREFRTAADKSIRRQLRKKASMSRRFIGRMSRRALPLLVTAAALGVAGCGKNSSASPTAPSTAAGPSPAGALAQAAAASVQVTVNPDPVPWSGQPILDTGECADYTNTWFYDTVLHETAGGNVTFTTRIDLFDGKLANNLSGLNIVLGPHDTVVLHTRWCSGSSSGHSAQSIFGGTDGTGNAVSAQGQVAQLGAGPSGK